MTMKSKMLRVLIAGIAGLGAALTVVAGGGLPGAAVSCQRSVAIDPQVTVSEGSRALSFVVHTGSCAAAGGVSFVVTSGSAEQGRDFKLANGQLRWEAGDGSSRRITAAITADTLTEDALEDFKVTLAEASADVRIAAAVGQGRIFDNDTHDHNASLDAGLCLASPTSTQPTSHPTLWPSPSPSPALESACTIEPGHIAILFIPLNASNEIAQSVDFETFDGDLIANVDYVPVRRRVLIPAGATAIKVEVKLLPHAFTKSGRHFNAGISNYTAGEIIDGEADFTVWL